MSFPWFRYFCDVLVACRITCELINKALTQGCSHSRPTTTWTSLHLPPTSLYSVILTVREMLRSDLLQAFYLFRRKRNLLLTCTSIHPSKLGSAVASAEGLSQALRHLARRPSQVSQSGLCTLLSQQSWNRIGIVYLTPCP